MPADPSYLGHWGRRITSSKPAWDLLWNPIPWPMNNSMVSFTSLWMFFPLSFDFHFMYKKSYSSPQNAWGSYQVFVVVSGSCVFTQSLSYLFSVGGLCLVLLQAGYCFPGRHCALLQGLNVTFWSHLHWVWIVILDVSRNHASVSVLGRDVWASRRQRWYKPVLRSSDKCFLSFFFFIYFDSQVKVSLHGPDCS